MRRYLFIIIIFTAGWLMSRVFYQDEDHAEIKHSIDSVSVDNPANENQSQINVLEQQDLAENGISVSSVVKIKTQLAQEKFADVVQLYLDRRNQANSEQAAAIRTLIFQHTGHLIISGKFSSAQSLLLAYLKYEYNDGEALLLLAEAYQLDGQSISSIETLYTAKSYSYTNKDITAITQSIRSKVNRYTNDLRDRQDYLALLTIYQRLTLLEPQYAEYSLGLAKAYMSLGNSYDARIALQTAIQDPITSRSADQLLDQLETTAFLEEQYNIKIPLIVRGDQFLVEVVLNDQQNALFLLDTGASLSMISTSLFERLGLLPSTIAQYAWFATANGKVEAPIIQLQNLSLGDSFIRNINVGVLDLSTNTDIDGLLGMNFLRHFHFYINQKEQILQLSARSTL